MDHWVQQANIGPIQTTKCFHTMGHTGHSQGGYIDTLNLIIGLPVT